MTAADREHVWWMRAEAAGMPGSEVLPLVQLAYQEGRDDERMHLWRARPETSEAVVALLSLVDETPPGSSVGFVLRFIQAVSAENEMLQGVIDDLLKDAGSLDQDALPASRARKRIERLEAALRRIIALGVPTLMDSPATVKCYRIATTALSETVDPQPLA